MARPVARPDSTSPPDQTLVGEGSVLIQQPGLILASAGEGTARIQPPPPDLRGRGTPRVEEIRQPRRLLALVGEGVV